jgi:myosin heavy subunit
MTSIHSTLVFVPDDEHVWLAAEIQHENSETGITEVTILDDDAFQTSSSKHSPMHKSVSLRKAGLTTLPLQNPDMPAAGVDDMCSLAYLHEPSILDNLRRYALFC